MGLKARKAAKERKAKWLASRTTTFYSKAQWLPFDGQIADVAIVENVFIRTGQNLVGVDRGADGFNGRRHDS